MTLEDSILLEQMKDLVSLIHSHGKSVVPNEQLKTITEAVVYYIELIDAKDNEIQLQNQQYANTVSSLEQRIVELEAPRTCDGCIDVYTKDRTMALCGGCSRNHEDCYRKRETR